MKIISEQKTDIIFVVIIYRIEKIERKNGIKKTYISWLQRLVENIDFRYSFGYFNSNFVDMKIDLNNKRFSIKFIFLYQFYLYFR